MIADLINDPLVSVIKRLNEKRDELYMDALNHFGVPFDEVPFRARFMSNPGGTEHFLIDDKPAITFVRIHSETSSGVKVAIRHIKHY